MRPLDTQKAALRSAVKTRLAAAGSAALEAASAAICARVAVLQQWRDACSVLLYLPAADEPDVTPLLRNALTDKALALPRVLHWAGPQHIGVQPGTAGGGALIDAAAVSNLDGAPTGDIVTTRYNLRQPRADLPETPLDSIDLCLVPGRAFDRLCNRLGRGGGFYDALFRGAESADSVPRRPRLVGVCFDEQVVDAVPADAFDVPLDIVITPSATYTR